MNKVILVGRIGKDPEIRNLTNGTAVCSFSLATSKKYKDKNGNMQQKTDWHNIQCWGKLAETASKYLHKGGELALEGEINYDEYEKDGQKKHSTKINCNSFDFIGSKANSGTQGKQEKPDSFNQSVQNFEIEEDLPF